jgi:hypothetical protein
MPNGDSLLPDDTIGQARDAYRRIFIYDSGHTLYFQFEGSELAVLEAKRWFNAIGYAPKYRVDSFFWMKDYRLAGSLHFIYLFPSQYEGLRLKMHEVASAFGLDIQLSNHGDPDDHFPNCKTDTDYYGEAQVTQFISTIV